MGLVLNTVPSTLQAQLESLQRALQEKDDRIRELERELYEERIKNASTRSGAEALRKALGPLYQGLQTVFGHLDAIATDNGNSPLSGFQSGRVWESWKQKLGGKTAEAIQVLLMHGPMTHAQLRIQLSCATRTVTNIVGTLKRAGLIERVGGKISLREL